MDAMGMMSLMGPLKGLGQKGPSQMSFRLYGDGEGVKDDFKMMT